MMLPMVTAIVIIFIITVNTLDSGSFLHLPDKLPNNRTSASIVVTCTTTVSIVTRLRGGRPKIGSILGRYTIFLFTTGAVIA
jgi:hypothetical protein